MNKAYFGLFIAGVILLGCKADTVITVTDPTKTTYSRDVRTDICFATLGRSSMGTNGSISESFSISAVPCSEPVLALIPTSQGGRLNGK